MSRRVTVISNEVPRTFDIKQSDGQYQVAADGGSSQCFRLTQIEGHRFLLVDESGQRIVHTVRDGQTLFLHVDGHCYTFALPNKHGQRRGAKRGGEVLAPMPGKVTRIYVEVGQAVESSEALYALEAMKMESVVRAPVAGRVTAIRSAVGDQVEGGARVLDFEAERSSEASG
ncbi:MAG: biotin/lipoyl-binding protein [Deltaproteobacteria bacterium]|nr:biotin/lipoyl-binding protein [Deltaproteobacteria bacterium]